MKDLRLDSTSIANLKENSSILTKDGLPAWHDAVLKLIEDWQTMEPAYNGLKNISEMVKD